MFKTPVPNAAAIKMIQSIVLLFSVEDKSECIEQDLRCKDRRRPRWVVVWRNLNQIDADNHVALGHGLHHFQYIIIQKPTVTGRSCPSTLMHSAHQLRPEQERPVTAGFSIMMYWK